MPPIIAAGSPTHSLSLEDQRRLIAEAIAAFPRPLQRVLIVPPDYTRANSGAGPITAILYELLSPGAHVDILPAIGTHVPMSERDIRRMYGDAIPLDRFLVHDWRGGLARLGTIPGETIAEWSGGRVDYPIFIEINTHVVHGNYDAILSVGQIVPHEVVGMANYTKNICVGVGGRDTINKSHFLGAAYGMEQIMGQSDSPPRRVFNYGCREFMGDLPIWYFLTVMERDAEAGGMHMRGLYVGNDDATFEIGCRLSQQCNINLLDKPLKKVVVYLDPEEFKSTWLGNKAVYRTRMAIADAGELIVLAPALREFGEDPEIDRLIRTYGYRTTPEILQAVEENQELRDNLSAAAHLIHGSSEERFRITYCPGPDISHAEIEGVGYQAGDLDTMLQRYNPETLPDGYSTVDGEEIYYISNPALGLWALNDRFQQS